MKKNEYLCKRENFANYKVNHRFESPEFGFPDEVFEFVNTEGKGVVQFAFTKGGNVNIKGDLGVFHAELGLGMDAEEFFIQYAHLGNVNKLMSKPNYSSFPFYRYDTNTALKELGDDLAEIVLPLVLTDIFKEHNFETQEDLFTEVGRKRALFMFLWKEIGLKESEFFTEKDGFTKEAIAWIYKTFLYDKKLDGVNFSEYGKQSTGRLELCLYVFQMAYMQWLSQC